MILVIAGAFWAKGYYNDRYVAPEAEANEDSWLVDADGVKQQNTCTWKCTCGEISSTADST